LAREYRRNTAREVSGSRKTSDERGAKPSDWWRKTFRASRRKLALRLIDIGFKILDKELHPDKGGSRNAMARLNRVRDRLKHHAYPYQREAAHLTDGLTILNSFRVAIGQRYNSISRVGYRTMSAALGLTGFGLFPVHS
jgi:hypothetical protein